MNTPIILEKGCKNCRFSTPASNNMRECRFGPPTANAILIPDPKGNVTVAGVVSVFPRMDPNAFCHKHERALAVRLADAPALAG